MRSRITGHSPENIADTAITSVPAAYSDDEGRAFAVEIPAFSLDSPHQSVRLN